MRRYAVLQHGGDIHAYFEALEDSFDELQRDSELLFGLEGSQDVRGGRVHVWREQWREEAKIELVDDDELKTRYLVIEAPDADEADRVLAAVAHHLPLETLARLRDDARRRAPEEPATLVRLALAEEATPDRDTVELVRGHLSPSAPAPIRNAAVTAADLLRSPDLVSELERLSDAVGDDRERQVIEQAIRDSRETRR
jgi:hypothetical protein